MSKFVIRTAQETDHKNIVDIYNSNHQFLLHHLGVGAIDEAFISQGISAMRKAGFRSCVIAEQENSTARGVLDYQPGQEVYLSLLMLSADLQGKGTGSAIYTQFEADMIRDGRASIRIDVVNDYQGNLVPFWKRRGFLEDGTVTLEWGNKKSSAVVMRKYLQ